MKMLTELSGSVIRVAAAAIAQARRSLPSDEEPASPAMPEAPPQSAGAATGEAPAQAEASVEAPAEPAAPPVATPAPPAPTPHGEAESGAANEMIDAAVAKATGLSGDRLAMLHGAVEAAGRRTPDVRLVRVFGLDEQVTGAIKVGAYQYVVDLFPASMRQVTAPGKDRGRRGGGSGRGRGGGDRGVKGSGVGGFSMDSLREDRKTDRGGRGGPGGGRRSGGGGGGPGGPPGGAPKK
jgi:translation initiation factor IF-2